MKNRWQWIRQFAAAAHLSGDSQRLRLVEILDAAHRHSHENPDQRLAFYEQGRDLARSLDEPWWVVVFEYWKSETLLYYKFDPEAALAVAAKMVVETRKPLYADLPERVGLSLNFIAAYSKIDPIGYEKPIREAIAAGRDDWANFSGFHEVYWQLRTRFLTAIGDADALEAAWKHLRVGQDFHARRRDNSAHYIIYALADLLPALWKFDRDAARQLTLELAGAGCELAPLSKNERLDATFTMWRALGERSAQQESRATRSYRAAKQKQRALSPPLNALFAPAILFHEVAGETEKMLEICDAASEVSSQHGLHFETANWKLRKCQILAETGRDFGPETEKLREVALLLPSKSHWETEIVKLISKTRGQ